MSSILNTTEYRTALVSWLERNRDELAPFRSANKGPLEESVPHGLHFQKHLYAGDWTRYGWPEQFGGLGGQMSLRGVLYDELTKAGYHIPESLEIFEIIAPMLVRYAPHLAKDEIEQALSGNAVWCQGFSEPGAGSDLAHLKTKAVAVEGGYKITGQKIWTSLGHLSQRCGLLARTGSAESAHRGLSMFWLDMESPGVDVRPIKAASGTNEFCEVFFDDVFVPSDRLVGEEGKGWGVAMYLLQFERGMYAWIRQSWLHTRLTDAINEAGSTLQDGLQREVGEAFVRLSVLRYKAKRTVQALSRGVDPGPDISVDKILLGQCEQKVTEIARKIHGQDFLLGSESTYYDWRSEWFWARASTIFGGAAEVQKDIVAQRILGLPKGINGGN